MRIATAAEMRAIEEHAVALGVSLETLMENAGRAVFEAVQRRATPPARIAVVCGTGNNGGDGLVVARLAHEAGYQVHVYIAAREGPLKGLPALQLERLTNLGVQPLWLAAGSFLAELKRRGYWNVIVDAVLGTGAHRTVSGEVGMAICALQANPHAIVSIDVPSGIEADTGAELGHAVSASETVLLGFPKPYLFQGAGLTRAGEWSVADIGIPKRCGVGVHSQLAERLTLRSRAKDSHKGNHGNVVVIAGSAHYRGAAVLAAMGALRAGAGLVTVASTERVVSTVAAHVPEAVLFPLPEEDGSISLSAASELLSRQDNWTSCVCGPGLTTNPSVSLFLETLWAGWSVPTVVDADALNLVAQGLSLPKTACYLTPHPGEAARLLDRSVQEIADDRFGSAGELAGRFQAGVLLKGAYSLCTHSQSGVMIVNSTGNSGMATGGMGDVLAGVAATLASQDGVKPVDVLWQAALLHGKAGDLAAEEIGGIGYSASDLAHFLPRARSILTT